jgi:hypothetical protein
MPYGSRIVALSALVLAGCQSAPKPESKPLRATVQPAGTARSTRAETASPVVKSADFQKTPMVASTPQPGVAPPVNVPTIPSTSFPAPTHSEPVPPPAPGLSTPTQPPIAESGANDTGGIVMPNLLEKK